MLLTMQTPDDRITSDLRFSSRAQNDLSLLFAAIGAFPTGDRGLDVVAVPSVRLPCEFWNHRLTSIYFPSA
jgi:hypothetical protein